MEKEDTKEVRPGRLFFVLWLFSVVAGLVSLQVRLAVFGGTGWLTSVKYTTWPERLGLIAVFAMMMAALVGVWTLIFDAAGRLLHARNRLVARLCATIGVVILVADLLFRHKVTELLGNAFSFFEFATGVGGVWRMIVQAFGWYGDIIIGALIGLAAVTVGAWFFFRWVLKPGKRQWLADRMSRPFLIVMTLICTVFGFLFMSVMAPAFPGTNRLLADETMAGASFHSLIHVASDWDGDGYGAFDLPPDDAPTDGSLHPHAVDIPGDGIDQDLLMGDLNPDEMDPQMRAYIEQLGSANLASWAHRRHVVVVLMESVRYDMLDATIDGQPVMPEMHRMIKRGAMRVDGFFATRGFTQNSVTQTFWGDFYDPGHSLVDDFKTMGYRTVAYSGEDMLDEGFDESLGWNRSGDDIVDPRSIAANVDHRQSVPARMLMDEVESYIDAYDKQQPMFLYVFYQDPHFPYNQDNPPVFADHQIKRSEIKAQRRSLLYRTYAGHVHDVDKAAGRLFDALEKRGMLDDTLLIFVSDHGESLFDDGYLLGHGIAIGDIMTHGVMVVYGAQQNLPSLATHLDLRPMIYRDLSYPAVERPSVVETSRPVMQFIGATSVPSAISFRYSNGDRIAWEFATGSAWRETDNMSCPGQKTQYHLVFRDEPSESILSVQKALEPSGKLRSPIVRPLRDEGVQDLIRAWEYMQFHGRK